MNKPFQIAIDGPVGSGKSTVTKLVAERLGYLYVDTGATYRVASLVGERKGFDFSNEQELVDALGASEITMRSPLDVEKDGRLVTVFLDGEDVSWQIRTEEISRIVPKVAAMAGVRKLMVQLQQDISRKQPVVMEGRDITYRVLPEADMKIYLTATSQERAKRRQAQLLSKGEEVALETVQRDLIARDEMDMGRETDPLQIVEGAWVLDTTGMSIEEVVDAVCQKARETQRE